MNAMNQIVARDVALNLPENPLLFTLSDYLREVSLESPGYDNSVQQQLRLLESCLRLQADVLQADIVLRVVNRPLAGVRVAAGLLSELATCALKCAKPAPGGSALLKLAFKPVGDTDDVLRFSMAVKTSDEARTIDAGQMGSELAQLPCVASGSVTIEGAMQSATQQGKRAGYSFRAPLLR